MIRKEKGTHSNKENRSSKKTFTLLSTILKPDGTFVFIATNCASATKSSAKIELKVTKVSTGVAKGMKHIIKNRNEPVTQKCFFKLKLLLTKYKKNFI